MSTGYTLIDATAYLGQQVMSARNKRVVTACIPCHNRKQKCNRRFPCHHCTHRRRAEESAYHAVPASRLASTVLNRDVHQAEPPATETREVGLRPSLVESSGWARESSSNTMALLKTVSVIDRKLQSTIAEEMDPIVAIERRS
ncbi:uncharacterized protein K489DRAFT_93990 [Dissoconium aciculare CBS 342.82]|uniref:Zn(2)-C6 fungal-type domain-containing protein n=1 Tax=Dissoconium aciculare CBS 342.82 TaxID=1314786 RepID=A0A6J3LRH5_9PEZI|nr:uncharacterized protein K489DRAFT_93990 [Dissoconium aciculare CBS 342.82]KAF1818435.1 hypothetical protein K489DRAFT_93990 [Dissoconium aciculare CBS 342.82]